VRSAWLIFLFACAGSAWLIFLFACADGGAPSPLARAPDGRPVHQAVVFGGVFSVKGQNVCWPWQTEAGAAMLCAYVEETAINGESGVLLRLRIVTP